MFVYIFFLSRVMLVCLSFFLLKPSNAAADTSVSSSDYTVDSQYRNAFERNCGFAFEREAYLNGEKLGEDEYNGGVLIEYRLLK